MEAYLMPPYLLQELILLYAYWSMGTFFFAKTQFIDQLDLVIIWLVRVVGIFYLLQLPVNIIFGSQETYVWVNRYTGPYWFTAVFPLLVYLFATQGLWWGYFRKAKYWRLFFCFLILLLGLTDQIMVWMLSFQRDYIPAGWAMIYHTPFLHLESIIFFCIISAVGYFIIREKQIDANII